MPIMKAKAALAAMIIIMISVCIVPHALSAERNVTGELIVLPYSVSAERGIMQEFASPRYTLSREQNVGQGAAVLASFAVIDYTQSVSMFYGSGRYREMNPLLGSKPTKGAMIAFGVIGVSVFHLISSFLSEPWRQIFIDSIIASERMNIEDNRRVYRGWNTDGPPIRGRSFNGVPIVISIRLE
jgi:hypothetical protein